MQKTWTVFRLNGAANKKNNSLALKDWMPMSNTVSENIYMYISQTTSHERVNDTGEQQNF